MRKSLLISLLLVLTRTAPASAIDPKCDGTGLDEAGQCVQTVEAVHWCTDDGAYRVLFCQDGDICAKSLDDTGDPAGYTCIPRSLTACADVPDVGVCASPEVLLWCNGGEVESADCDGDTECGWDVADTEFDCVAKGRLNASEGVSTNPSENAGPEPSESDSPELFMPGDIVSGGPGPTLQSNVSLDPSGHGGTGCVTASRFPQVHITLAVTLLLGFLARRLWLLAGWRQR